MANTVTTTLSNPPMDKALVARTGTDLRYKLTVKSSEAGTATVLDLTSTTWTLKISEEPGDTALLSKTTTSNWSASGIKVLGADTGEIALVLVAADIAASLPVGQYYYQVTATTPAGQPSIPSMVIPIMEGTLTIVQGL